MLVFVPNHESNKVCPEGLLDVLHRVLRHLRQEARFVLQYLGLQGCRVPGLISCGQDGSFEVTYAAPVEPKAALLSPAHALLKR